MIFVTLFNGNNALADKNLDAAISKLKSGYIVAANQDLMKILKPKPKVSGRDLIEAQKYFAACRAMMGQKAEAAKLFKALLKTNPKLSLDRSIIRDETVHDLLGSLKPKAAPKPKVRAAAKASSGPRLSAEPLPIGGNATLEVNTNARSATVFINDEFLGLAGQPVSVKPGTYLVKVTAAGFEASVKKVKISPRQNAKIKINLSKARKEAPAARAKVAGEMSGGGFGSSIADEYKRPKAKRNAPAAMDYTSELPNARRPAAPAPSNGEARSFVKDLRDPNSPPAAATPNYGYAPQPQYQQPYAPQYAYPQQPTPGYGGGGSPTFYIFPSAPPAYGYGGYPQAYPEQNVTPPHLQRGKRKYDLGVDKESKKKKPKSILLTLLPGGAGQFQNKEPGKGFLFLLAQGGGIGYALYNVMRERDYNKKIEQEEAINPVSAEPTEEELLYEQQKATYRQSIKTQQTVGWGIFAAAWVISIADAIFMFNDGEPKKTADVTSPLDIKPVVTSQGMPGIGFEVKF